MPGNIINLTPADVLSKAQLCRPRSKNVDANLLRHHVRCRDVDGRYAILVAYTRTCRQAWLGRCKRCITDEIVYR
jgi:hypothetical protein